MRDAAAARGSIGRNITGTVLTVDAGPSRLEAEAVERPH
jgi:hypothetical protein